MKDFILYQLFQVLNILWKGSKHPGKMRTIQTKYKPWGVYSDYVDDSSDWDEDQNQDYQHKVSYLINFYQYLKLPLWIIDTVKAYQNHGQENGVQAKI